MHAFTIPRGPIAALLFLVTTLPACVVDSDDDAADTGSSSAADDSSSDGGTTSSAGLEIAGEWVDDFMGTHSITDTQWIQGFGADMFTYTIDHFDNDADVLIAQSQDDMTWSRFDWTQTTDGTYYYCQTAFMQASAEAAEAMPRGDDSDPATAGCGMFAWSALHPG